jgi:hypothetical protein
MNDTSEIQKHTDFLTTLGLNPNNLTPEQLSALSDIKDPEKMQPEQTLELFKKLGIDINKFLHNLNNNGLLKNKTRRNTLCPCGSDKKWKKCCGK